METKPLSGYAITPEKVPPVTDAYTAMHGCVTHFRDHLEKDGMAEALKGANISDAVRKLWRKKELLIGKTSPKFKDDRPETLRDATQAALSTPHGGIRQSYKRRTVKMAKKSPAKVTAAGDRKASEAVLEIERKIFVLQAKLLRVLEVTR